MNMSTVENLFVQIFERKNRIIEQVKQQTDLYSQHLASKLIIEGITPPPWLLNNHQSSNPQELNKEELISEILVPRPRPPTVRHASARCSLNKRPVVTDDNEDLSHGTFSEIHTSDKGLYHADGTANKVVDHDNNQEYALKGVPELDVSVNSPLDQRDTRFQNNRNDLDRSLARIQRSKSRQKALQLRNSAQGEVEGCSSQQKNCDAASIGIGLSTPERVNLNYGLQILSEPCVVSNGSGGLRESAERNHEGQERDINLHTGESSKHETSAKQLDCVKSHTKKVDSLSDVAEKSHTKKVDNSFATASSHKRSCNFASKGINLSASASQLIDFSNKSDHLLESFPVGSEAIKLKEFVEVHQHEGIENRVTRSRSNAKQLNCINDSLKVDGSAGVVQNDDHTQARSTGCVSGRSWEETNTSNTHKPIVKGCLKTKKKNDIYCGRITRSKSMAKKLPCLVDDSHATISAFSDRLSTDVFATAIGGSSEVLSDNPGSFKSVKPSLGSDQKSKKTQNNIGNEVTTEPVTSTVAGSEGAHSISADSEKSSNENYDTYFPTGSKSIIPCSDNSDTHNQQGNTEAATEGSPTFRSRTSNSDPEVGVECLVANPSPDCFMSMKPKQLHFDDMEKCNLKRSFTPNFEEKSLKPTDDISNTSLEPTSQKKMSGSPVDNRFSWEQSIPKQEISSKLDDVPGSSFALKIRDPAGTGMNGCVSDMNGHLASGNTIYESMGRQCSRQSPYMHDDKTLSNDVGHYDAEPQHVKLNLEESHNSVVELHAEGGNSCDRNAQCLPASYVANTKIAAAPYISSLTKKVTGDSQDCLAKNFEIEDPTFISQDAKRQSCMPNDPNLTCFSGENSDGDVTIKCNIDSDSHQKENDLDTSSPLQSGHNDNENLNLSVSSDIENAKVLSLFDGRFRSSKMDSWPQVKRKNIEDKQANCFSDCPKSEMSKLYRIHMDAISLNINTIQEKSDNVVEHTPFRVKSSNAGISEKINCHLREGAPSSPKLQKEVGGNSCDRNACLPASYVANTETAATHNISTMAEKVTGNSQDCLVKELEIEDLTSISQDTKRESSMPNDRNLYCFDGESSHGDVCVKCDMDRDSHQKENDMPTWSPQQSGCNDEQNLNLSISSEIENSRESLLFDGRFRSAKLDSWPQVKRRRIEDRQTKCFSVCPNSQMSKLYHMQMDAISLNFNTTQEQSDSVLELTPFRAKSSDVCISEKKNCSFGEGISSLLKLQNEVDAVHFKQFGSASSSDDKLLRVSHVSSLFKEPAEKELETGEEHELLSDAEKSSDEQDISDLLHLEKNVKLDNPKDVTCLERKSHTGDQSLYSQSCVSSSPQNKDLDITDADQSKPVLEGFIIDASTADGEMDIAQFGISYDNLNFPSTTIQRASILERICKSASANTPLSHLTSAFGLHHTQNLYQSLPNGLLEHLDLRSTLFPEEGVNKQLRASYSCVDEVNDSKLEIPCSDYQSSYQCQFGGRSGSQYQSPVGKFWERISSHSTSSEKRLSSNPELTCFPIEEDPNSSEENEAADEVAGKICDEFDSTVVNSHVKRLPLADVTDSYLNPPASISEAERSHARGSLDSLKTDASCTGHHNKAKRKLGSSFKNMSGAKVKQSFLMGAKGIKQGKESLRRSSRQKLSSKSSFKSERQNLSEKGARQNNIVSNVTSFIPLVQQKQAAAVCTVKRDIKVKALEAAEAAKRLEEKKENERKMRKEAMKHERARLEQENSKQLELHKKKKEEEKKKKEADAITRKRLREEEEKNDKEKKRKRVEEARRQQREHEDKTHAKRAEKGKGILTIDEKMTDKKKCNSDVEKCQTEKERVGKTFKKQETEPKPVEPVRNDSFQATTPPGKCHVSDNSTDHEKVTCVLGKPDANTECVAKKSQEKSYEISPYQCSDDEDDEDEDLPIRKFVPSWSSKLSVANALPLQQTIDPDSIFPPESFCSMDEVLVPRKLQKRHAPI
ncbi:uncharacterized protein [Nicotiana sylvestris]|uniref:Uncharacterized protein LOC104232970 isoform X2 n=1 Tax=Nicotiana sylvestris TaxID=4096 RepID=A0A1U7X4D9_NICSY|nr:PREDICTED: uncharacterized protein LOC104232970 isoform X2 [Nicotiana sylvestris]